MSFNVRTVIQKLIGNNQDTVRTERSGRGILKQRDKMYFMKIGYQRIGKISQNFPLLGSGSGSWWERAKKKLVTTRNLFFSLILFQQVWKKDCWREILFIVISKERSSQHHHQTLHSFFARAFRLGFNPNFNDSSSVYTSRGGNNFWVFSLRQITKQFSKRQRLILSMTVNFFILIQRGLRSQ